MCNDGSSLKSYTKTKLNLGITLVLVFMGFLTPFIVNPDISVPESP